MDQELIALLTPVMPSVVGEKSKTATNLRIIDGADGEIELDLPDAPRLYRLKPLAELFGTGVGAGSIDPMDEHYQPLFMRIEESIVDYYRKEDPRLMDASVQLTLDRLGMNPESEFNDDPLAQQIQVDLRLLLSLVNYSRQEVRAAIRKIGKSVARHTRLAGPRGYLSFIREQLRR